MSILIGSCVPYDLTSWHKNQWGMILLMGHYFDLGLINGLIWKWIAICISLYSSNKEYNLGKEDDEEDFVYTSGIVWITFTQLFMSILEFDLVATNDFYCMDKGILQISSFVFCRKQKIDTRVSKLVELFLIDLVWSAKRKFIRALFATFSLQHYLLMTA